MFATDVSEDLAVSAGRPHWTVLFAPSCRFLAFVGSPARGAHNDGVRGRRFDGRSIGGDPGGHGPARRTGPAGPSRRGRDVGGWVPGVLVVDDEEDIRVLLRAVIEETTRGFEVVGQAATGEEAIERCRQTDPDVILLDQRMPGLSGLETAELILRERPHQQIILYSAFLDDATLARAKALGIRACLSKGDFARVPEVLWKVTGA